MNFYRLADGKITEVWTQFAGVGLLQQLDTLPSCPRTVRPTGATTTAPAECHELLRTDLNHGPALHARSG